MQYVPKLWYKMCFVFQYIVLLTKKSLEKNQYNEKLSVFLPNIFHSHNMLQAELVSRCQLYHRDITSCVPTAELKVLVCKHKPHAVFKQSKRPISKRSVQTPGLHQVKLQCNQERATYLAMERYRSWIQLDSYKEAFSSNETTVKRIQVLLYRQRD